MQRKFLFCFVFITCRLQKLRILIYVAKEMMNLQVELNIFFLHHKLNDYSYDKEYQNYKNKTIYSILQPKNFLYQRFYSCYDICIMLK